MRVGEVPTLSFFSRLALAGPVISEGTSSIRPEILVTLKGPYAAPKRSIDVSALSGWLMLRSVERQAKQISAIETERREIERREAERRDAERREAERREAEKREAEKREAERQEAERKAAEAKASTSSAALPVPQIMQEESPARVMRPQRPRQPAAEQAPALPPPMNIGPPPGAKPAQPSARSGNTAAQNPPPPPRSALDYLFGVQR